MSTQNNHAHSWEDDIYDCFKLHHITQVPYVPDAGHAHLIKRVHDNPQMIPIVLTTEEEGIASSCGAWLGGQKSLLLMQIMENTYGFMTGVFLPYRFGGQAPQLLQMT